MKAGRTLQELAIELDRQAVARRDFVVNSERMSMTADQFILSPNSGEDMQFSMSGLFHRQLGSALGIPAKYYDKMRTDYPALLTANVNGWLGRDAAKHTVRTLDGTARAFLSDRYRRIDNYEVAKATLPVISEIEGAKVESCEVTETRMYIKVVNPRLEAEVRKGDIVQAGIIISNSEVGLGSVSVMPLVLRLVCLNGMVINDLGKRKYHVGRENEESWELYSDDTLKADDTAFMMKLADIVRTAVDEAKFMMIVDQLRDAAGAHIKARIPDVIELTAKQYGFNQNEKDDILTHLITGGDLTLWGLGNAVTRASADVPNYDRATQLETVGWEIVSMDQRQWRELNGVTV